MDDMIGIVKKIFQMDETARKLAEEADAEKIASREEVKKKRQQVYDEYLENARTQVEEYKQSAKKTRYGRRFLGTNGATLWLWSCLPKPGAPGP